MLFIAVQNRDSKNEVAIKFNDNNLKIKWPSKKVIVSPKDDQAMSFFDFNKKKI